MPDRLLDHLAADAPAPGPTFTDDIVTAARGRRRRTRATIAAAALVAAVGVGTPLVIQLVPSARPAQDTIGSAGPSVTADSPPVATPVSDRVAIYAALLVHSAATADRTLRGIDVRPALCPDVSDPAGGCPAPQPLDAQDQRAVLELVRAAGVTRPVRFAERAARVAPGSMRVPYLTFGRVRIDGLSAQEWVQTWCGFDCVRGDRFELAKRAGTWTVVGSSSVYLS